MYIEMKNISKTIRKNKILDDVSIRLEDSKIYGIKGKNGSGKTMLLRILAGLIFPTEGSVCIDGKILHKDIPFPESIGVLIESPAFINNYSAFKNLRELASFQNNISDEHIYEVLEAVGLDSKSNKKYKSFSLGMKQKLGIACALLGYPDIIILDEPINALDDESVILVKNKLMELKENRIIVVVCHDKEELEYLSDEIIVIKEGKII